MSSTGSKTVTGTAWQLLRDFDKGDGEFAPVVVSAFGVPSNASSGARIFAVGIHGNQAPTEADYGLPIAVGNADELVMLEGLGEIYVRSEDAGSTEVWFAPKMRRTHA